MTKRPKTIENMSNQTIVSEKGLDLWVAMQHGCQLDEIPLKKPHSMSLEQFNKLRAYHHLPPQQPPKPRSRLMNLYDPKNKFFTRRKI